MNYGELKAQFEGLLKRRDMTPTQSDTFLQQAISRTQRVLRVPPMEKSITITYDGVTFTGGQLPIPNDYLKLINITVNDEPEPLRGSDLASVLRLVKYSNGSVPTKYVRRGGYWVIGAPPRVGDKFRIDYYTEFSSLSNSTDSNFLTVSADDLVIYAALSYAGDWFVDKRAADWEAKFLRIKGEIEDMAATDELVNAQVSPAYFFPED
jgi:hypothetical protein